MKHFTFNRLSSVNSYAFAPVSCQRCGYNVISITFVLIVMPKAKKQMIHTPHTTHPHPHMYTCLHGHTEAHSSVNEQIMIYFPLQCYFNYEQRLQQHSHTYTLMEIKLLLQRSILINRSLATAYTCICICTSHTI